MSQTDGQRLRDGWMDEHMMYIEIKPNGLAQQQCHFESFYSQSHSKTFHSFDTTSCPLLYPHVYILRNYIHTYLYKNGNRII